MEPIVSIDWLNNHFNDPNLIVLDASLDSNITNQKSQTASIKIKGALAFNMKTTFSDKHNEIPNMMPSTKLFTEECQKLGINSDSIIIVYDNLGIYWSPRVRWMFKTMGHEKIAVLDGGLPEWYKSNYACEKKETEELLKDIGNFQSKYNEELILNSSQILNNIIENRIKIIDARSQDRFYGRVPEPRKNMESGHIPNSINLPYKDVLNGYKYCTIYELQDTIKKLQLNNNNFGFSCGSGITACIIMLAFEILGYNNNKLYDGSWSEWGILGKFPIEL